jgi:hypothetical protein
MAVAANAKMHKGSRYSSVLLDAIFRRMFLLRPGPKDIRRLQTRDTTGHERTCRKDGASRAKHKSAVDVVSSPLCGATQLVKDSKNDAEN